MQSRTDSDDTVSSAVAGSDALLVGRESASELLGSLVAAAMHGGSAAVVVGEPGIGKTTLLASLAQRSVSRVLSVRGVEGESVLSYACAADLLTPLRKHFGSVPPAQRRALEVALTLSDGEAGSALAVYAGALGVLAAAGDHDPLVILVDDLQWVDLESRRLLLFVARRLEAEHVVIIFGLRDQPGLEPWLLDLPTFRLEGLTLGECAEMVRRRHIPAPPGVLRDVVRSSGGNPLAVIETLRSRKADAGPRTPGAGLALGPTLQRAWRTALGRLDERARRALFLLAVARWPGLPDLPELLEAVGLSLADLAVAEQQKLVQVDEGTVELRHPLLRQVVIDATPLAFRLATYIALAELATPEQRAWYLSMATTEPDDGVAGELDRAGTSVRVRGAHSSAAHLLRRSAELTTTPTVRAGRLLQAANDSLLAGDATCAEQWSAEAAGLHADAAVVAGATMIRSVALTWMGHAATAYDDLVRVARDVQDEHPVMAAELLGAASMPAGFLGDVHRSLAAAMEGDELLAKAGAEPSFAVLAMSATARALAGQIPAASARMVAARSLIPDLDRVQGQHALVALALCHLVTEHPAIAHDLVDEAIDTARNSGAPHALAYALNVRAEIDIRTGRWTEAYADATEALSWAEELQQHSMIGFSLVTLARIEAGRGQRAAVEQRIARSRREVGPFHVDCQLLYEPAVLGLAALSGGDPQAAAEHLVEAWNRAIQVGLVNPTVIHFVPDLAEAYVRCGNRGGALELIDWLEERALATGLGYPLMAANRCRGLLVADAGRAAAAFEVARTEARKLGMPFELARVLLCEGEVLRRGRQPVAARAALRQAQRLFDALGARPWAEMATRELRAAGAKPSSARAKDDLEHLTPQELQVARMIAAGKNNIEAAAALFVSRKTIEAHLTRIYRKLAIRSRSELTALVLGPGSADGRAI